MICMFSKPVLNVNSQLSVDDNLTPLETYYPPLCGRSGGGGLFTSF